jgi:hypothetical protein
MIGAEGATFVRVRVLAMSYTHPTARNWVLTKFHTGDLEAA